MDGRERRDIRSGLTVDIVLKKDQGTGRLTRGVVRDILTKSANHPHGIKVRLMDGQLGRVKKIINYGPLDTDLSRGYSVNRRRAVQKYLPQ